MLWVLGSVLRQPWSSWLSWRSRAGRAVAAAQRRHTREPAKAEAEPGKAHAEAATAASHGGRESGHAAEQGKPNPMKLEPTLAIWTVVVFLGLFLPFSPSSPGNRLSEALHHREEHLEHCLLADREGAQRERAAPGRTPAADGPGGRQRQGALRQGPEGLRSSVGEQIIKYGPGRGRGRHANGPQRDIATARDQALAEIWSQDGECRRHGRRAGAFQGTHRRSSIAGCSTWPSGIAALSAAAATGTEVRTHDRFCPGAADDQPDERSPIVGRERGGRRGGTPRRSSTPPSNESRAEEALDELEAIDLGRCSTSIPHFARFWRPHRCRWPRKTEFCGRSSEIGSTAVVLAISARSQPARPARSAASPWPGRPARSGTAGTSGCPCRSARRFALDAAQEEALRQRLAAMTGATPILEITTDPGADRRPDRPGRRPGRVTPPSATGSNSFASD